MFSVAYMTESLARRTETTDLSNMLVDVVRNASRKVITKSSMKIGPQAPTLNPKPQNQGTAISTSRGKLQTAAAFPLRRRGASRH